MRRSCTAIRLFATSFLLVSIAQAADRPIVAVFDVENQGSSLDAKTIDRLTNYLCSLMAGKGYQVVPRSKLKESLLEKKKESYQQCYDQACQIEIGQELAAQKSLATQIILLGGKCKVALTLYDLKRSASEKGTAVSGGCDEAQIVESLEKAVADMMGVGVQMTGARAPDLGEYEKLAATAAAQDKKALEERQQYKASLEKAWESVKIVAATKSMGQQARAGLVRKFLQDFPQDNPHEAKAKEWIATLDQGKEPLDLQPGNREGMVLIPAGEFLMGCSPKDKECDKDEMAHKVWVREFWMDATEVTVAAYRKCVDARKCKGLMQSNCNYHGSGKEKHPVNCADWYEADTYCKWAGKRLPTEAEWEKAARGGSTDARYGELKQVAWYMFNRGEKDNMGTHPVGKLQPNAFGLFDMLGNVEEWCSDWFGRQYYVDSPERDPAGPVNETTYKVQRGGSWQSGSEKVRASFRQGHVANLGDQTAGFRCVSSASVEK